jgi:hypothetical protein
MKRIILITKTIQRILNFHFKAGGAQGCAKKSGWKNILEINKFVSHTAV